MHPISVCIIAKNEESRIEQCLASVKPCGFEIVVVDTGSTDRTKEIAAKNFSLQEASNNWIFMIDCDETVKEIDVEELNYFRKHLSEKKLYRYTGIIHEHLTPVRGHEIPSLPKYDSKIAIRI